MAIAVNGGVRPLHAACRVSRSTNQSINNTTLTKISYDAVRLGDASWWSAGDPTKITVPYTGYYTIGGHVEWDLNATKSRYADIYVNNTLRGAEMTGGWGCVVTDNPQCNGQSLYFLRAGDYIECRVYQNSGGALNALAESDLCPDMWAIFEGY